MFNSISAFLRKDRQRRGEGNDGLKTAWKPDSGKRWSKDDMGESEAP